MKRFMALAVAMLFTAGAYADMLIPRFGFDFPGKIKVTGGNITEVDSDTEMGYSLGIDYLHPIADVFAVGLGLEYQLNRKIKDTSSEFGFMPIYLTGMLAPFNNKKGDELMRTFLPYAKVNLGYNVMYNGNDNYKFLNSSLNGGFYWAAGVGAKLPYNLTADVMYSSYAGQHSISFPILGSFTSDDTYTKVSLNIGYAFDLGGSSSR